VSRGQGVQRSHAQNRLVPTLAAQVTPAPADDSDTSFTLDEAVLARRRVASARRLQTEQIPVVRAVGFAILCVLAAMQDLRMGVPLGRPELALLIALNLGYAALSWLALRAWYGRTGRLDLGLFFLHVDLLVWLPNLRHLEHAHLFFACLMLVRVADQVGYGFRRAIYFNHVVLAAYLAYSLWIWRSRPADALWSDRLTIAATMYLLGTYLAFTGLVSERLRGRMRQAMHAARALVANLEQKKRELEVRSRELEEASRRAEQASVAKAQFLATISHEIRTPMNGVLGTTELLLDTPLMASQRRLVENAHFSATALLTLIDDVLDLSRIQASKLTLHAASFDLAALMRDAVDLMATTARDKPITLGCTIAPQLPARVEGDPTRLRQVLVNLLHNAVKFTDRGRVVLEVIVLGRTPDAVKLRFEVRDTGIGIAEDQFALVFDAFTQADTSSTRRHGGSGLGLAIVKELAELMGGRVGVDSRVDEGSTFWFELTLKTLADPAASPLPEAHRNAVPAARILLAEDDAVNQIVVAAMLKKMGCAVDVVGDGNAARAAAAGQRYDLIFMDCHMPGMDGFEATRRIRDAGDSPAAQTPIVALTADALAGDRDRCLSAGMDDYMTKPVNAAQLAAAVQRWAGATSLGR
jgi:signal transduction histidine kinase/CheY-like chemotaxis protein